MNPQDIYTYSGSTTTQVAPLVVDYPVLDYAIGFALFLATFWLIIWMFKK